MLLDAGSQRCAIIVSVLDTGAKYSGAPPTKGFPRGRLLLLERRSSFS